MKSIIKLNKDFFIVDDELNIDLDTWILNIKSKLIWKCSDIVSNKYWKVITHSTRNDLNGIKKINQSDIEYFTYDVEKLSYSWLDNNLTDL
jgi:hypothetical protein